MAKKSPAGYVRLYRKTLDSTVWKCSPNVRSVFITCLLMANWKPGKWLDRSAKREVTIPRGSFVTTMENLAKASKVTLQSLRTSLNILSTIEILTRRSTQHATYISVLNYAVYQDGPQDKVTVQLTFDQHTTNTRPTWIEEVKEVKKGRIHPHLGGGSAAPQNGNGPYHTLAPALVSEFKLRKGLKDADPTWDRRHLAAHLALATELIGICGSFDQAKKCISDMAAAWGRAGLNNWKLESIVNHAHEWLAAENGKKGKTEGATAMDDWTARAHLVRIMTPDQRARLRLEERGCGRLLPGFAICRKFWLKPSPLTKEMVSAALQMRADFRRQLRDLHGQDPDYAMALSAASSNSLDLEVCYLWEDFVLAQTNGAVPTG